MYPGLLGSQQEKLLTDAQTVGDTVGDTHRHTDTQTHRHTDTHTHTHTHSSPCRKQQRTALCLQRPTCGCVCMCIAANVLSLSFMLSWILWVFHIETYTFGAFVFLFFFFFFFLKIAVRLSSWRIWNLGSDLSSNKWVVINSLWVDNSGIGNCMYFVGKGKCDLQCFGDLEGISLYRVRLWSQLRDCCTWKMDLPFI